MLVQEYRFKGGASAFSKFTPLRDLLPGGWRRWKAAQLEFDTPGMTPLVVYDDSLFDGTAVKLAPAAPPPTPGTSRHHRSSSSGGGAPEEPFAGRYTAVCLTAKASPAKPRLLAVSYHGQSLVPSPSRELPPRELSEDEKLANAQRFVQLVGEACARLGVPALVGGDWATSFGFESRPVPCGEGWQAQLRPVASYHPSELASYRYRNSMAPVDFLVVVNPTERESTLEVAGVTAMAHDADLQQCFDHDPLLATFAVRQAARAGGGVWYLLGCMAALGAPGLESIVPPSPLEAAAAQAASRPASAVQRKRSSPTSPPPRELHAQMGALAQKNDELQQQLAWLRREAAGAGGADGALEASASVGALSVNGEDSSGLGVLSSDDPAVAAALAGGRGGSAAALLLEGSASTGAGGGAGSEAGGGDGEWQSLVTQLASELALVKETSGDLLQQVEQRDRTITALHAKLRVIAEQAGDGLALAEGSGSEEGGLEGLASPSGRGAQPVTPEQKAYARGGLRSPAGSTNGF
ncbi:hypothetical protein N2152v2_005266 [Parachlorella kessleri]